MLGPACCQQIQTGTGWCAPSHPLLLVLHLLQQPIIGSGIVKAKSSATASQGPRWVLAVLAAVALAFAQLAW